MPRKRTGSAFRYPAPDGPWHAQVTFPDGTRSHRIKLDGDMSEARAKEVAAYLQEQADNGKLVRIGDAPKKPTGESVADYSDRWLASLRDPQEARAHLRLHILPLIGEVAMVDVDPKDIRRVVVYLDGRVKVDSLAWKSAQNIWGTVTKMFADACHAKHEDLRVLDGRVDPSDGVRGPDRGDERRGPFLYPSEAERLIGCTSLPSAWRAMYAVALYTGLRSGELSVLRVGDVDLDGGFIHVHKARDRRSRGAEKGTKGKRARRVPIELALRPLLAAMTEGRDRSELLLGVLPMKQKAATKIRTHLSRAGVGRSELYRDDKQCRPLSFHDARHSYAVWLAIRGEAELTIQRRLGHTTTEETQRYINEAELLAPDVGAPFEVLPAGLIAGIAPANRSHCQKAQQYQSDRRESNPLQSSFSQGKDTFPESNAPSAEAKGLIPGSAEQFRSDSRDVAAEAVGRFVIGLVHLRSDPIWDIVDAGDEDGGSHG